jgi:hypothetical protein
VAGAYPPGVSTQRLRVSWFLVFLALLWLGATFVYFGDTGKYSDDYWVTGRFVEREGIDWSSHPWQLWPYFWRPLHLIHVWIMNTVFWRHDWVMHLELALVHAAVCVVLYRLLVRLGSARGPAIAATLLYGTSPLLGEAIGWSSASCNAVGSLLMLVTLHLGCRFGSTLPGREGDGAAPPAHAARGLIAIAIMSFATACFYEPAAAGLAAIPIVVWTACSRAVSPLSVGVRLRRTVLATIAAGVPCVLYVALLVGTAPRGQRGAAATVGSVQSMPHNVKKMAQSLGRLFFGPSGRDFLHGSIEQGLAAAREHPFVLGVVIATALAGLLAFLDGYRARPQATSVPKDRAPGARGQLLLLGIALFVVPWAPFIAQHAQSFALRSLYVPLIGVAFLIAAAGNGLCRWMATLTDRGRAVSRVIATIAVGLLAIAGQVGLVGVQTQFQTNARQDALVMAQFAAISSHVEPNTVFIILAVEQHGAATSCPGYNGFLHTPLKEPWCATTFARRSMRRSDIQLVSSVFWSRGLLPIDQLGSEHVRETDPGAGDRLIPWTDVVPLWIDSRARMHIVDSLTLKPLDGATVEVRPPRALRLAETMSESAPVPTTSAPKRVRLVEAYRRARVVIEAGESGPASAEPGVPR